VISSGVSLTANSASSHHQALECEEIDQRRQ